MPNERWFKPFSQVIVRGREAPQAGGIRGAVFLL